MTSAYTEMCIAVARRAAALIEQGHCSSWLAETEAGKRVPFKSCAARKFSAFGALCRADFELDAGHMDDGDTTVVGDVTHRLAIKLGIGLMADRTIASLMSHDADLGAQPRLVARLRAVAADLERMPA